MRKIYGCIRWRFPMRADCLAKRVPDVDAGFATTLGLLHDLGKLAMMARLPKEYELLQKRAADSNGDASHDISTRDIGARDIGSRDLGSDTSSLTCEALTFGVNHAALGAELAARWKLPADLVQAIRFHHRPQDAFHPSDPGTVRKAVHVVRIANQLAKYCYPYADHMEFESIADESFNAVGLDPSIDQLLDAGVRSAISRVIIFSQSNTKRTTSSPRRFLRFLGESDLKLMAGGDTASRISGDMTAIDELFESATRDVDLSGHSVSPDGTAQDELHVRFIIPATPSGVERAVPLILEQQRSMSLHNDQCGAASVLISSLLPNLLEICDPADVIEIAQRRLAGEFMIGVRSAAMAGSRRFKRDLSPTMIRQIVEAQFAPLINLRWFDKIAVNDVGSAMLFVSRI